MDEYIFSLDIGSSKICGAAGKLEKSGKVQIIGVVTVPCNGVKKGIVVDIDSTSSSIRDCVEQLKKMLDSDISRVFISLPSGISQLVPSNGIVAVSSEDKEIKASDINRVLNAARVISVPNNKEIIGVIPKEYIVDGYDNIKDPIGMSGMKLEVEALVILSQTTIVSNLVKSVQNSGLQVEGFVLEPIALAHSLLKKDELNSNIAIADIGYEKIDISIYRNGNLEFTDFIPLGGNSITNDISICLKIPFSEAEKLKIKYGSMSRHSLKSNEIIRMNATYNDNTVNIEASTLLEIMEARVEEILGLIHNKLMSSGYYEDLSEVIVVGGGISYFSFISDLGRKIIGKPLRIGTPDYVGAANPIFNTAVGIIKDIYLNSNIKDLKKNKQAYSESKEHKLVNKKSKEYNESVLTKIKVFLAEFF